jgi:protein PsiE
MWRNQIVVEVLQRILNASLIGLGFVLCYFLLSELYFIAKEIANPNVSDHDVLERVLIFFLYFGFISMIVKYFKENYHFPLRYLLYIGITATVRFIIVNRDNFYENLISSLVIFVLMLSYLMLTPKIFFQRSRD